MSSSSSSSSSYSSLIDTVHFTSFVYETDEEYRNCVFDFFKTEESRRGGLLDEEGDSIFDRDEILETILLIYEKTDHIPWFHDLYLKTAANLFTENTHVGLILLFSYDWFRWWIPCLEIFLKSPGTWNPDNENAKQLIRLQEAERIHG